MGTKKPWYIPYSWWNALQRAEYFEKRTNELQAYIVHSENPDADKLWCPECLDFTQQTWNENAELWRCHICGKLVD